MKKSATFLACSIALTLLFYLLAYFFLPPPPPSAAMMLLFAAIALTAVWLVQACIQKLRAKKSNQSAQGSHHAVLLFLSASLLLTLIACNSAHPPDGSRAPASTTPETTSPPPPPAPAPVESARAQQGGQSMPRVTGTALLASDQKEDQGYGLYSYALLSHPPGTAELPRYQAYLQALLALPEASKLGHYLPKSRINVTYIPVVSIASTWEQFSLDQRVDYVLAHYDYARGAALLASLPQRMGPGPVITSLLTPLSTSQSPRPVLVQDLSTAQPVLMGDYVKKFTDQVAQDRFWQASTLANFALTCRNVLETAAVGLGMSKDAVNSWVQYFK